MVKAREENEGDIPPKTFYIGEVFIYDVGK